MLSRETPAFEEIKRRGVANPNAGNGAMYSLQVSDDYEPRGDADARFERRVRFEPTHSGH
jgi:hypothetical protein